MVNTILARRVNHIVAKGDNPAWPKGSKSRGFSNNFLNLPGKVTFTDGSTITYVYAADGTKLRTVHVINGVTTTTDYCGNVVYENGVQKYLLTEEGYVTLSDKKYHYYLRDHQGNNRVVIASDGTVEEVNHYYPFGGVFASTSSVQPYKYNGKELDSRNGLNWYDYGARHYDPSLGRFTTMDRFADKYSSMSPYQYGANNPACNIDINGDSIIVNPNPNGLIDQVKVLLGFDTKYQSQVKADLQRLKIEDEELGDMITQLEESENVHTITMPDKDSDYQNGATVDKATAQKGIPQGTVVYYDPFNSKTSRGNIRTPRIGLAHELQHSYDADAGIFSYEMIEGKVLRAEIRAINTENRIRNIIGEPKRIKYGNTILKKYLH